jgi:cyclopropane fatty-acyl-phospholipid synthase-like methyltransferase
LSETAQTVAKNAFLKRYDRSMRNRMADVYYDNSGFFNFGYWLPETKTQREASENLVNQLLAWLPEKNGTILDVACGMGASTRMLLDYYPPDNVYAVNVSEAQVGMAAGRAPGCGFAAMDAAHLGFADESFDNIICVEAAFHFTTRADFFREAYRLLKPGGRLVHTDILHRPKRGVTSNYLASPDDLANTLRAAGFKEVDVRDKTNECIGGVGRHMKLWPGEARKARRINIGEYAVVAAFSVLFRRTLKRRFAFYTLSTARKPLS